MESGSVTRRVKLGGMIALPVTAALLAFAAVAFACVPQASIKLGTTTGPVGTPVTVTGTSFTEGAAISVYWGGVSGRLVGTSTGNVGGSMAPVSFRVPADSVNGNTIVAAKQVKDGAAIGSPSNVLFTVTTPGGTVPVPASNLQTDGTASADGAAGLAPAPAAQPAAVATPAPAPAAAPRVRPAPVRSTTAVRRPAPAAAPVAAAPAAPAPEAAPAPAAEAAPAPAVAPAPVATPAPESAPATSPARRSVMVSMASDDNGSPALAIALVGIGLLLALGASAVVLAGRRDRKAPVQAKR